MPKIKFDVLTLFPNFFDSPLSSSLTGKAIRKGIIEVKIHDLREFGIGRHKQVDDRPFGGGPGMVLRVDVSASALDKIISSSKAKPYVILLDPSGVKLDQAKVKKLKLKKELILVCGHYEGVDQRFKDLYVDEEISIGDYVLSGGEPAALVLIDSISRLVEGFMSKKESSRSESFETQQINSRKVKLLDYPVYTRPEEFSGLKVPEVLLSGDHEKIKQWRLNKALEKTAKLRPDLLKAD